MGNLCAGDSASPSSAQPTNMQPAKKEPVSKRAALVLYGDPFDPDTRTLQVAMHLAAIDFEFTLVDQFQGEHLAAAYLEVCPIAQVPCLTEKRFKLMGDL